MFTCSPLRIQTPRRRRRNRGRKGGESLFERKKCVEKLLLDDGENHSRGDEGTQSGEMAAERATIMLVSMSFLFLPFLHQHNYLACNIHFSFNLSFHQSTVIRTHMPQFLVNLSLPGVELGYNPQPLLTGAYRVVGKKITHFRKMKRDGQRFMSKWVWSTDLDIKPLPTIRDVPFSSLYLHGNYNHRMKSRNRNK